MRLRASLLHGQLGPAVAVERFALREALSELFDLRVEVTIGTSEEIDIGALLDTACLLQLDDEETPGNMLVAHGIVDEAASLEPVRDGQRLRLTVRPRLNALSYRVRTRLFQDKTAVEIVDEVLRGAGIPAEGISFRLSRSYPERDLCMQYRESELNLVLRLLEDEGVCFWFEHSDTGHVLVIADGPDAHPAIDGAAVVPFSRRLQHGAASVAELIFASAIGPDVHVARDWNWHRPGNPVEAEQKRDGARGRVFYEYPGGFADGPDGGRRAKDRLEAADETRILRGRSSCHRLRAGRRLELSGASPSLLDGEWLLTAVDHSFEATPAEGEGPYSARFSALPGDAAFRPRRRTPRSRVRGKELAVVTGPSGEDIHVDPMGRVKIHFLWDREGPLDDKSSAWVRVQQLNTGGSMILPRVGWEVDVGFLDGDPDRPVVLQKLYNRDNLPPHGLPDAKTKTALQSHTVQGGEGVNALTFEDGSGGMECSLTASKDLSMVTGHDASEEIGTDALQEVGLNLATRVGGNEEVSIGAGQSSSIGGGCALETVGDKTVSVGGMDELQVTGNAAVTCDGSRTESVAALANLLASHVVETVNGSSKRKIGAALSMNAVKGIVEVVGGSKTEITGGARIEILRGAHSETVSGSKILTTAAVLEKAGGDVSVSAKGNLAITVGGPMAIKAGGAFTITGDMVCVVAGKAELKVGSGEPFLKADGKLEVKAPNLAAGGKALLRLKGTLDYKEQ